MRLPPRFARRLLAWALSSDPAAETILGDLQEDYARLAARRGIVRARAWYWREAVALAASRSLFRALKVFVPDVERWGDACVQAARTLRRAPGFTAFVGVVIGLGVGAVTTVYSVVKPLMLASPFEEPDRLVWIANTGEAGDSSLSVVSSRTLNLIDFRERAHSFAGITGYDVFFAGRPHTLATDRAPEQLGGVGVAHDFLDVLGLDPTVGRGFTVEEGQPDGPLAVVLAYGFWRERFGGDAGVVGTSIVLNNAPHTVVGVLPAGFDFESTFSPGVDVDVLLPFVVARDNPFQGNTLAMIGRLRPGVTPDQAQQELSALVASLGEEDPSRWGLGAEVSTLREHLTGPFGRGFLLLGAAAATLLLIVCVNVGTLTLARAPTRAREMAVRKALGAPRSSLLRQLVVESLGVSAFGAAAGCGIAWLATRLVRDAASIHIPLMTSVDVDPSAMGLAVVVAAVTGVMAGVVPALHVVEGKESAALGAAARGTSSTPRARRTREGLVLAQVALVCSLLVVGTLLMTSLREVLQVDLGFDPDDAVALQLSPSLDFATHEEKSVFYADLVDRVSSATGIQSVGLADALPLGRNRAWPFAVVDQPDWVDTDEEIFPHVVAPGYLRAMRTPLVRGRDVAWTDREDGPRVVLLNETTARRVFGGTAEAMGRRLRFWGPWEWEVVGVVRDVRHIAPDATAGMEVYFPLGQMTDFTTMDLVVRSSLPLERIAPTVRASLIELDPGMPTQDFWTVRSRVDGSLSDRRFALGLISAFGAVALLLAGLGIFGVLSQSVTEREPEIGIRMALGASAGAIVTSILRRTLVLTCVGILVGWMLSLMFAPLLDALLFGVTVTNPLGFVGSAAVLVGVATLAAGLPVRRAVSTEVTRVLNEH